MGKKKKKTARQTATQKLLARCGRACSSAAAAGGRLNAAFCAGLERFSGFVALPWSAAPLAVLMLGLTLLTYYVNGKLYLTGAVFMYFPSTVTYHLFDYSVGFISRALVGSVLSLFTRQLSVKLVLAVSRAAVFALFVLQSGVAALVFKKAFLNKNFVLCAAAVAFVSSPITALTFVYNLGLLDQYNLVLAVLFLYIADTKAGVLLTPVLGALGVLIHQEFAYTLLPAILLIALYYAVSEPRLRRARVVSLAVTVCVCGALAVYFLFFEKYGLKMTEPELDAYLAGKFKEAETFGVYKDYYTFYFFGRDGDWAGSGLLAKIKHLIDLTFASINPVNEARLCAVLLPFYALLEYCWGYAFRRAEKGKRLPYLGFMLLPLLRCGTFLISDDMLRFADEAYLANFMLLAAAVKKDDALLTGAVQALQARLDRPVKRAAAAAVTLAYLIAAVLLYTVFLH